MQKSKVNLDIKPLINIAKIRYQRTYQHMEKLQKQIDILYVELTGLNTQLSQIRENMRVYRKNAYMEKFCSRIKIEDIETINHKLRKMEKNIEETTHKQKELSTEINNLHAEITQTKQKLRFYNVKEEKYLYILAN